MQRFCDCHLPKRDFVSRSFLMLSLALDERRSQKSLFSLCRSKEKGSLSSIKLLHIPIEDVSNADIYSYFEEVVKFIGWSHMTIQQLVS